MKPFNIIDDKNNSDRNNNIKITIETKTKSYNCNQLQKYNYDGKYLETNQ